MRTASTTAKPDAGLVLREVSMSISTSSGKTHSITSHPTPVAPAWEERLASSLQRAGTHLTRSGLVVVFLWIGGMKFTNYEAEGIRPFVENSPLMSWLYQIFSVGQFSALLGVAEIIVGLLIATRHVWPKVSAAGSLVAASMFAGTLTFIVTTPGWEPSMGFPALSVPGQFLLKDSVLLGASVWTAAEAWQAAICRVKVTRIPLHSDGSRGEEP
jgi:uncharacterized membrane protein YkgB